MMYPPTKYQIELHKAIENWVYYDSEVEELKLKKDAPEDIRIKYKKYMELMQKTADQILYVSI